MPIMQQAQPTIDQVYNEEGFRLLVETHLDWLRNRPDTVVQPVTQGEAYRYQYDLFGFLYAIKIPQQLHFAVMRMSKLNAATDFNVDIPYLYIPSAADIDQLRQLYVTSLTQIGKK